MSGSSPSSDGRLPGRAYANRAGRRGPDSDDYFARQVRLPEIGAEGQRRLADSRVLLIGAGGTGCPAAIYLASAGVGTLTIVDGDRVALANLHRQTAYTVQDVGQPKASTLAARLVNRAPAAEFIALDRHLEPDDTALIAENDLVVECTDTFSSQFLVHDLCYAGSRDLVTGSIRRFAVTLALYEFSIHRTGCMRCVWPEAPPDGVTGSSAEDGILGATAGILGTWMAQEAILHLAAADRDQSIHARQLLLDTRAWSLTSIAPRVNADCPLCGAAAVSLRTTER